MKGLIHKIIAISLLLVSTSVFAWTIGPMSYQGRLLDSAGVPVTGSYNFKVRIYDALSGGTLKFSEDQSSIAVDDGVYSFLVSTGTNSTGAWDINLWNTASLYLEIEVGGQTLTPRHLLASAPFAFQANLALTTNNALALGGKTAAQYNSALANICVSSKGKWLELANSGSGACLGIGASFPGPTLVNWNTLSASNNFANIDLSRADVSGINFSGADLTATIFKKTTYSAQGMSGANLSNTLWDSAVSTDASAYTLIASTNLTSATFQNMDMSKWNLSSIPVINLSLLSAASISSCTAGLPANWLCRGDGLPSSSNKFLLGPGVNLAAGSAASAYKFGSSYLNLGKDVLNSSTLTGASFVGNVVNQNLITVNLTSAHFDYARFINIAMDSGTDLSSATLINSKLENVVFGSNMGQIVGADFSGAELAYVSFGGDVQGAAFVNARLRGVTFMNLSGTNFTNSILDAVSINAPTFNYANNFTGVRFYNGFRHGTTATTTMVYSSDSIFANVAFIGGTLSGDFHGQVFTGTVMFDNVAWQHLDLCGASLLARFVDQSYSAPYGYDDIKTVSVPTIGATAVVECPSGQDVTGGSSHCGAGSTFMTPIVTPANCTAGVP